MPQLSGSRKSAILVAGREGLTGEPTGEFARAADHAESTVARLEDLHEQLLDIVSGVGGIDIRSFEQCESTALLRDLVPQTLTYLTRSIELTRGVVAACDTTAPDNLATGSGEQAEAGSGATGDEFNRGFDFEIDTLIDGATRDGSAKEATSQTADLAFVANIELRDRQRRITGLDTSSEAVPIVSECDSALRRIRKSLTAVELVIAGVLGVPHRLDFETELAVSLQIRCAYTRFRQAVAGPVPTRDTLRRSLRAAGTRIAMLVGRAIYPQLRVRDRLQIRAFQGQILAWLRGESSFDLQVGRRLWQDLVGFLNILSAVSRRQELVEHDRAVIGSACCELQDGATTQSRVADASFEQLRALYGLDHELDELLASEERSAKKWIAALARMRIQLRITRLADTDSPLGNEDCF